MVLKSWSIIDINYSVTLMGKGILCYHCGHHRESGIGIYCIEPKGDEHTDRSLERWVCD